MLWRNHVFRRGDKVHELWDDLFRERQTRLLYIAGCGFDIRVTSVLRQFLNSAQAGAYPIEQATLLLIEFSGYDLDEELREQTLENCSALRKMFEATGDVVSVPIQLSGGSAEHRATHALREGTQAVLAHLSTRTDVMLDVSSLPRVVYLALMTGLLAHLIPDKAAAGALVAGGTNLQVLVAEDAALDSKIRSEDPSDDLVTIPGFGGGINVESMSDWPVVWFPMLGEGRTSQFEKVATLASVSDDAEVCPVLPHPSLDPRRGDKLLVEYRRQLFDSRETPMTNIVYAHESHPFEAYRQVRQAIERYRASLSSLGGCRLLVTPLASKLMTIAGGLACFEMRPPVGQDDYALGIPYAAPTRYVATRGELQSSRPELSALLLTGDAYAP
jgi:hypothetical protein